MRPVVVEFRDLLDREPVLRMSPERMIAETRIRRSYRQWPFDSVNEQLLMLDEVLTLAPKASDEMAATPPGAVGVGLRSSCPGGQWRRGRRGKP